MGNLTTTINQQEGVTSSITHEVLQEKNKNSWVDAYKEVDMACVLQDSNVITYPVIYKVKETENGNHSMK